MGRVIDTVLLLIVLLALLAGHADAHDWYDRDCCSNRDCAPVADGVVTETKDGVMVTNFGLMPETDQRLHWSKDDRDHICVMKRIGLPSQLQCVYRKRKFM